jgi:N-glycosylase/DNA lyase
MPAMGKAMIGGRYLLPEYYAVEDGVLLQDRADFEPVHIFDCGQCFRWHQKPGGGYSGVALGRLLEVEKTDQGILFKGTTISDFEDLWVDYFDLRRDYGQIKDRLSSDRVLSRAIEYGYGIRILKQDIWETLVSFIISANNRIPRIKRTVESLCECYGNRLRHSDRVYYDFPSPARLAALTEEEVKACGCGFRAGYIIDTARRVAEGRIDLQFIAKLSTADAREALVGLRGVGPKVADCVMLYSMQKYDAFPVDVWVKKVMEHFYMSEMGEGTGLKRIAQYADRRFGDLAGFAQQYLFYYARDFIGRGFGKAPVDICENVDKK